MAASPLESAIWVRVLAMVLSLVIAEIPTLSPDDSQSQARSERESVETRMGG
jgi:hypothetical protein